MAPHGHQETCCGRWSIASTGDLDVKYTRVACRPRCVHVACAKIFLLSPSHARIVKDSWTRDKHQGDNGVPTGRDRLGNEIPIQLSCLRSTSTAVTHPG